MLDAQVRSMISALDKGAPEESERDRLLALISRVNIVLRHSQDLSQGRVALLGQLRDRLHDAYRSERKDSASCLAFLQAKRLLETI